MNKPQRFTDKPYGYFKPDVAGLSVKCPHCSGMGRITASWDEYVFFCESCGKTERASRQIFRYHTPGICKACGRYFNEEVTDAQKTRQKVLSLACPHCGALQPCRLEKTDDDPYGNHTYEDIDLNGVESIFGYPLWFCAEFDGKVIWALNREHLVYLIDYIGADLREHPRFRRNSHGMVTESDRLPKFMKLAKNRERLLKRLRRMLEG